MTLDETKNENRPQELAAQAPAPATPPAPAGEAPARPYFPTRPAKRRVICAYEKAARMYDAHP